MLHGHEKEEEMDMPMNFTRMRFDDTKRTRILKEVLRDSVRLHESAKMESPSKFKTTAKAVHATRAMGSLGLKAKLKQREAKLLANPVMASAMGLEKLHSSEKLDDNCIEMAGAEELSPLLRNCGRRIGGLCNKLLDIRPNSAAMLEREACEIRKEHVDVFARPPDEAVGVVQSRVDRQVDKYLAENVKFQSLEELTQALDKAESFSEIRKLFPERCKYHPLVPTLTNHSLEDPEEFRRRIRSNKRNPRVETRITTTRATLKFRAVPAFTSPVSGRTKRQDQSSPSLAGTLANEELTRVLDPSSGGRLRHWKSSPNF